MTHMFHPFEAGVSMSFISIIFDSGFQILEYSSQHICLKDAKPCKQTDVANKITKHKDGRGIYIRGITLFLA